jgi:hypothetical protein
LIYHRTTLTLCPHSSTPLEVGEYSLKVNKAFDEKTGAKYAQP